MTERIPIDITGAEHFCGTRIRSFLEAAFNHDIPAEQLGDRVAYIRRFVHEKPAVYVDGTPPAYDPDKTVTSLQLLRQFVTAFEGGAQGCMMDHEAAQHLALGIKQGLSALDEAYRAMFMMINRREPTDEDMARE